MYSFLLKNMILPVVDRAMSTRVHYFYKLIKRMQEFSPAQIKDWQNQRLRELINHAFNNTVYYRELFNELQLSPSEIRTAEDLQKIPVLTKEIIKKNYAKLLPENLSEISHKHSSTGGSSGDPLQFNLDLDSWSYITANTIVYWEKFGYKYGYKHLAIGSTSLFVDNNTSIKHKLYYRLKKKIGVNGVNMSDEVIENYIKIIQSNNIKFIYGYASAIYLLAKYSRENNIKLNIESVFSTSEILTDVYRNEISEAFNCNIVDGYGAHDGGVSAFQMQNRYYEVGYNAVFRLQNLKGNIGDILLTNLQSKSMPFINYQLGDKVEIVTNQEAKELYNGQLIKKVYGRTSDVFYLENGKVLTGPGFTILFKDLNVEAYQIAKVDKMHLLCKVIKGKDFREEEREIIISTMKKQAGKDCEITLEFVDEFPILKSGKKQYFCTS